MWTTRRPRPLLAVTRPPLRRGAQPGVGHASLQLGPVTVALQLSGERRSVVFPPANRGRRGAGSPLRRRDGTLNTDIKYLVASNLQGHPYFAGGMYGSATTALALKTDVV